MGSDASIKTQEIFGPVLVVDKFKTEAEAIKRANDTTYGLAAAIHSSDTSRCMRVMRLLRAGVWISGLTHFQNSGEDR
jgi:acyl-CoA reductase-like NAD-dependent aldehyde dehydrogenase